MVLFAALIFIYVRTIRSAFSQANLDLLENNLGDFRKNIVTQYKLDTHLRNKPVGKLTVIQKKKWVTKVEVPVLMNRAYLFVAKRFREYQRSPAPFVMATISFFGIFLLTLAIFSLLNFSIFRIDESNFDISGDQSFFSFVWYSFNAFVNNFVREITPVSAFARSLWMINITFSIFMLTVLGSLYYSVRKERDSERIDTIVSKLQSEGQELESFIRTEFRIASVDEASAELANAETSLFRFFLWMTER